MLHCRCYLLIKTVLLLNDKRVIQTPGKSCKGTEEGGERQKHEGLHDLILRAESKASCHRAGDVPQKWNSTKEQNQLQNVEKHLKHSIR